MPSGLIQNLYIYIYSLEPRWYHPVLDVNMFYTLTASKHLSLVPSFLTPECMSTWLLSISLWPPRRYLKIILPTLNSLSFSPRLALSVVFFLSIHGNVILPVVGSYFWLFLSHPYPVLPQTPLVLPSKHIQNRISSHFSTCSHCAPSHSPSPFTCVFAVAS